MSNATFKIKMTVQTLDQMRSVPLFKLEDLTAAKSGFKTTNTPPNDGYEPFSVCQGKRAHYWIRGEFDTPLAESDVDYYLMVNCGVTGWDALNPQMLMYLNGKMCQGLDVNHREVLLTPGTHYEMYNYCYTGEQYNTIPITHTVTKVYKKVEELYYDMLVPFEACRDVYEENSAEYNVTMRVLEECCNVLDLRSVPSEEFFKSVEAATEYLKTEYYEKLCSTEGKPTVNCIGHTHIDVEWLWDRPQTKEKIQRSFATAKGLMDQYPEYKFMLSQPQLYKYLKEEAPEKYDELKALIEEGRWEPEGSMFVECDCNLSSGESLVRQILYGKRYFKEEFGKESRILFLPDVFGYSAAMPQILKKSGVDYFITSKISWNDTNTMPHDSFIWKGIDGTEIFTNFITGQNYKRGEAPARGTTYVGNNNSAFIYGTWNRCIDKDYVSSSLNTFGFGDGGGGPTKDMLEKYKRLAKGLPGFPVATMEFIYPYMQKIEKEFLENSKKLRKTPKWVGELYLEYHRGTYTTQANNKKNNRKSEFALAKCEAISMTDLLLGGSYDKVGIDITWEKVLHEQFHDILPGSSIAEVYADSEIDYSEILEYTRDVTRGKLAAIADKIKTDGGILVYNALGFPRKAHTKVFGRYYITDEMIPALGYKVLRPEKHKSGIKVSSHTLENKRYKIAFDELGRMASIFDKAAGREVLSAPANEIRLFEDRPAMYDAWELDRNYATKMYIPDAPVTEKLLKDGDRAGIRYTRQYLSSEITQTIWIYNGSDRIDIENEIDWHEKHQIMKLAFPIDVQAQNASFEIQYGHTQRPTTKNNSWEDAKFEVCAHKWVDLSETGYGVALLNDCKYGYSVDENVITVSCLRSPTYPDKEADMGRHRFTVSLLPHIGTLTDGDVIREAYNLNQPIECIDITPHAKGKLGEEFSLVSTDDTSAIIECVKRAEDSDDMIVRLYESKNSKTVAKIATGIKFSKAYLCDLTEKPIRELKISGGTVEIPLTNFSIETIRFVK